MTHLQSNPRASHAQTTSMAEGGGDVPQDMVPKRGSSSVIWNWFGFKKSDTEQKVVIGKVCRQPVTTIYFTT